MKRAFTATTFTILLILVVAFGCRSGPSDTSSAETQRQFGVRMAKMNLWREAMFRFRRAVEMNPDDAMAHNNLAVAYEANGDFESAAKEYREALRLDRSNQFIQKNYSRFVEFTSRDRKRQQTPRPGEATTTAGPMTTTTGTIAPPPLGPPVDVRTPPPTDTTGTAVPLPPPPPPPPPGGSR